MRSIFYTPLEINSIEEYKKYYYKTDLHWNIVGAYQGYQDIITMLKGDFNIAAPKTVKKEFCFSAPFYGAVSNDIARSTAYDYICDYELDDIGYYDYFINGEPADFFEKQDYAEGRYPRQYSDYDFYFGNNSFERIYRFDQETGLNLLMIVDSFSNPINMWIASHFDNTVILDLRNVDYDQFSLKAYMEEYDIDAVVVMMYYNNLYYNGFFFLPVE